jgi:hypothetical protein
MTQKATAAAPAADSTPTRSYELIEPHTNGGFIGMETMQWPDGVIVQKKVLVILEGTRPGVWHNGEERKRKQVIYGTESSDRRHPKDDARAIGYSARGA